MKYNFLKIDKGLIEIAKIEAKKRMEFGFRDDNQGLDYKYNMILISCIGELVYQKFLLEKKIDFSFTDLDFKGRVIIVNNKYIEISTSGYNIDFSRLNLLYNDKQYEQTKGIDVVVQIFINGYNYKSFEFNDGLCNTGVIAGYIDFTDIKKYPVIPNRRRPNHVVSLDNLKPVTDLL
ncbi:hypothetical protein [Acholeplasma granularum]|uniref:hypothetical protein n=1 Tax=Acholeplasma granularum TaxID=264635 RepID=UPI00046F5DFF|nr:hypothetical protein [Acholeplasma granularum]